jgi:hypothetical protein
MLIISNGAAIVATLFLSAPHVVVIALIFNGGVNPDHLVPAEVSAPDPMPRAEVTARQGRALGQTSIDLGLRMTVALSAFPVPEMPIRMAQPDSYL